jgi:hypothetical protein
MRIPQATMPVRIEKINIMDAKETLFKLTLFTISIRLLPTSF